MLTGKPKGNRPLANLGVDDVSKEICFDTRNCLIRLRIRLIVEPS